MIDISEIRRNVSLNNLEGALTILILYCESKRLNELNKAILIYRELNEIQMVEDGGLIILEEAMNYRNKLALRILKLADFLASSSIQSNN